MCGRGALHFPHLPLSFVDNITVTILYKRLTGGSRSSIAAVMGSHREELRLCRMTPSAWKSGLSTPTYYVSQKKHKGFFRRIQEAVEEVPPNSRIEVVGGGVFTEKILINKPLELAVSKNNETPVLSFRSTVVTLHADEVLIEGFTIRSESTMPSVVITNGKPLLRECRIRGMEVANGASPVVEECQFADAKGHGIHLKHRSGGTFYRNVIGASGAYGVLVESVGEINFSYNTIAGSHLGQVCVRSSDEGVVNPRFNLNRITDDLDAAQQHLQTAGPADAGGGTDLGSGRSKEAGGGPMNIFKLVELPVKQTGMKVQLMPSNKNKFTFSLEDEDVTDPALLEDSTCAAGISVCGKGVQPHFTRNTIAACKLHGLVVKSGSGGIYEANYFTGNKGWAIFIEETDATDIPYFTHNHVAANGGGVKVCGCPTTFESFNVIFGNKGPQVLILGGHPQLIIDHNMFRNCSRSAIWCIGNGRAEITRNEFESCGIGIRLERGASPTISQCSFDSCCVGVLGTNGGRGSFHDCMFTDVTRIGAMLQNSSHCSFKRCNFYSCGIGLQLTRYSGGTFDGCTVQDSTKISVDVSEGAMPVFTQCVIRDGDGSCGVSFTRHGGGSFFRNQIFRHSGPAIAVSEGSDPYMDGNLIGLSSSDGVVVSRGGCGVFVNNIICECAASGVVITGPGSAPVLRQNYILDCGRQGLLLFDPKGQTVCEKNVFVGSRRCHVLLSVNEPQVVASLSTGRGNRPLLSTFSRSVGTDSFTKSNTTSSYAGTHTGTFSGSRTGTLMGTMQMAEPQCDLVIRNNIMWKSVWAGVIVDGTVRAYLYGNTISSCRHGVLVYGDGHVTLLQNAFENLEGGIGLGQDADVDVIANIFQRVSPGAAISTLNIFKCTIAFNAITNCDTGVYLRSATGEVVVLSNIIRLAKKCAVYQHADVVKSSRIYSNVMRGNAHDLYISHDESIVA